MDNGRKSGSASLTDVCLLPRNRDRAEHTREHSPRSNEGARIIIPVWGDRYLDDLLTITIPALLAPGNLPAFARQFDCELVLVTERRLFDHVARSGVIAAVARFAAVRLVPIDDLLSPWYGITLTYALVRGFADLGEAMTRTHLLFLNADFVVADGSYRRLAEQIKSGERLIVSPSYCMNLEATVDVLARQRDAKTGVLAMSQRELARLIIDNRHNTIRAKTLNQQLFRIHRYDQFYWYVDENTLLCRQMPIAVVYMRPGRVLTEMPTFWDYGVVSEYCPNVTPFVFGDSDDFLIAELRSEGTFRELLHLGWPTSAEIAADLSTFTTQDHRDYGRHTLVLHAAEIPAEIATAEQRLAAFVDDIYARLAPPISYRDHPFWAPNIEAFTARRLAAARGLAGGGAPSAEAPGTDPATPKARFVAWCARIYRAAFGPLQKTTPWHPYHALLRPLSTVLSVCDDRADVLIVSSGQGLGAALLRDSGRRTVTVSPGMVDSEFYQGLLRERRRFELCLCDLSYDDLFRFCDTLAMLRALLSGTCRVIVFHANIAGRSLDDWTYEFARGLFPTIGRSQIRFAGSRAGALSAHWFSRGLRRHDVSRPSAVIALAATLMVCAPLARLASWVEKRRDALAMPKHCTSMTIDISLP